MSLELTMLAYSVLLLVAVFVVQVLRNIMQFGLVPALGHPDRSEFAGWQTRLEAAGNNLVAGIALFAAAVAVATLSGHTNATTALGAQLFFFGRVAHVIIYTLGIPAARAVAWMVSIAGVVMVLLPSLG